MYVTLPIDRNQRLAVLKNIDKEDMLNILISLFHMPLVAAAKYLDVGTSFFKKLCRNVGIKRWGYRGNQKCEYSTYNEYEEQNELVKKENSEYDNIYELESESDNEDVTEALKKLVELKTFYN